MHLLNIVAHIVVVSLVVSSVECEPFDQSRPPLLTLRVTRDGLDMMSEAISLMIPVMATNISMPDVSLPVGSIYVDIKNLAVKNFSNPKIKYALVPPNKVNIDVSTGPIDITADWYARRSLMMGMWWERDQGSLLFRMDSFQISLVGEVGPAHPNGLPSLSMPSCTGSLGKSSVVVRDATKSFFIDMLQTFSIAFKKVMQSQMCSLMTPMISTTVNNQIRAIPDVLTCNHGVGVRYYVQPKIDPDYIEVSVKAALIKDYSIDHGSHPSSSRAPDSASKEKVSNVVTSPMQSTVAAPGNDVPVSQGQTPTLAATTPAAPAPGKWPWQWG